MKRQLHTATICAALFVCAISFALSGCRSQPVASGATIVFSQVPAQGSGAPDQSTIEGRVKGARSGQQIVLYARRYGRWGRQPYLGQPFTIIGNDGRWASSTQVASEYAALLVEPGCRPPELTESLPVLGPKVAALAIVNDRGAPTVFPALKTVTFGGYEWAVSSGAIYRAGSINSFDPANVWIDQTGALNLRISGAPGKWTAAEVKLTRSLGYGTYRFRVRDSSHLNISPRARVEYYPGYYAADVFDPDGYSFEVVHKS